MTLSFYFFSQLKEFLKQLFLNTKRSMGVRKVQQIVKYYLNGPLRLVCPDRLLFFHLNIEYLNSQVDN